MCCERIVPRSVKLAIAFWRFATGMRRPRRESPVFDVGRVVGARDVAAEPARCADRALGCAGEVLDPQVHRDVVAAGAALGAVGALLLSDGIWLVRARLSIGPGIMRRGMSGAPLSERDSRHCDAPAGRSAPWIPLSSQAADRCAPTATVSAIAAPATSSGRRGGMARPAARRRALTRSRSSSGAGGAASRSSRTRLSNLASDIARHPLLELLQGPAQPCRDRGRPDPEHAGGRFAVEFQNDA